MARSILDKILACTVFVGDVTPVGKSPDKPGNEAIKLGRPLINSNGAIEYGFALRKLRDSAVIGVLNENFGSPEDLPFDIIHKRWPVKYRIVEGAKKAGIHPFDDCVTIRPASACAFPDLCDRGWTPPSTLRWIACSIPIRACDQTSVSTRNG